MLQLAQTFTPILKEKLFQGTSQPTPTYKIELRGATMESGLITLTGGGSGTVSNRVLSLEREKKGRRKRIHIYHAWFPSLNAIVFKIMV